MVTSLVRRPCTQPEAVTLTLAPFLTSSPCLATQAPGPDIQAAVMCRGVCPSCPGSRLLQAGARPHLPVSMASMSRAACTLLTSWSFLA